MENDLSHNVIVGKGFTGAVPIEGIGLAGAPAGGVVSIQGVIGGTPAPVDTELPPAAALGDAVANPTTPMIGAALMVWDTANAQWGRLRGDPQAAGGVAQVGIIRAQRRALVQAIDPAANTGGTITLAAAGAGIFHYIVAMRFVRVATAALAGAAILTITTTNLGGIQWRVGNAMAAGGTQIDLDRELVYPLRSAVANTNTTIVFPAPGAAVSWSCNIEYFTSQQAL